MLLDILLLTGEEVPAHTDAYHAVVILDGMPLLATQYRVVDGFKLVFGIIQEPITRGGDAPVAKLIIYRQLIGGIKIRLKISIFYGEKVVHLADF